MAERNKKIYRNALLVATIILLSLKSHSQRIEYDFGEKSNVLDSIKFVVSWFKEVTGVNDVKKLNLFVEMEYSHGVINLNIASFPNSPDHGITKLMAKSNRFITVDKSLRLPILFETDILSKEIIHQGIARIPANGYYLQVEKINNEWQVTKMNITF